MRDSLSNLDAGAAPPDDEPGTPGIDLAIARLIGGVLVGFVVVAVLAFLALRRPPGAPPAEIAGDALLREGREVFLARCASCHGEQGRGNGPIAKGLQGPPARDLTSASWKHGDEVDTVLRVVREGVPQTSMPGWGKVLDPNEVTAAVAYVYYLGKRPVPESLRSLKP